MDEEEIIEEIVLILPMRNGNEKWIRK